MSTVPAQDGGCAGARDLAAASAVRAGKRPPVYLVDAGTYLSVPPALTAGRA